MQGPCCRKRSEPRRLALLDSRVADALTAAATIAVTSARDMVSEGVLVAGRGAVAAVRTEDKDGVCEATEKEAVWATSRSMRLPSW